MKICTITCHRVYNYGASLQAYALQHYLETLGSIVEIIDYNPWFHNNKYNPFWVSPKAKGGRMKFYRIMPFLKYIIQPLSCLKNGMFVTWGRKKSFDKFETVYYHLTTLKYKSIDELRKNPPKADIYIAGSDQIWNIRYENGKDPAYYLDFGDASIKRISYAASFATDNIEPGYESFVKKNLEKFNLISVREKTGLRILEKLGFIDAEQVLDPVFLLSTDTWMKLATKAKEYNLTFESYVLVYDFSGNDARLVDFVRKYAEEFRLKIVSINDSSKRNYADLNINDAGPLEFLNLIKNAKCVVGNSFHATAFSIIFDKEFYTFSLKGHQNSSRMKDLLDELDIKDRLDPEHLPNIALDYNVINGKVESYRDICKKFIKKSLE